MTRLRAIVQLPRRVASLAIHGVDLLQQAIRESRRTRRLADENRLQVRQLERRARDLEQELRAFRKDVRQQLQQIDRQLAQVSDVASARDTGELADVDSGQRTPGRAVPMSVGDAGPPRWDVIGSLPHPDPAGREWLTLHACPICRHGERTIVNEWNKLILMPKAPDDSSARYDYAVCHGCGILYATRRPTGERYRFLVANFGDASAKHGQAGGFTNPLLNPYRLNDEDRRQLKRLAAPGVFVSEHQGLRGNEYLEGLLKDRFASSIHVDLIGSLLAPAGARVLEIRPRTGAISESLRRLYGADVCAMPIWESQELLLQEVYGIPSIGLVDYDQFDIPHPGPFDLIVCNHMLTHAVRPERFFAVVHQRLKPGGHLYLYNEPDDAEYLSGKQGMFATLNALHMQAFDGASFRRGLAANAFEVVFHKRFNLSHISVSRRGESGFVPITDRERRKRVQAYSRARDRSILSLREHLRERFAGEWSEVLDRGVAGGVAELVDGRVHLVAPSPVRDDPAADFELT
jgi:SAM-dependent methyltransferase